MVPRRKNFIQVCKFIFGWTILLRLIFAIQQKRLEKAQKKCQFITFVLESLLAMCEESGQAYWREYPSYQKVGELLADMHSDISSTNLVFIWLLLIEYTQWYSHTHTYTQDFMGKDIDLLYSQLFRFLCSYWLNWARV